MSTYLPARIRMTPERRTAIAKNAADARAMQYRLRAMIDRHPECECGCAYSGHWSIPPHECRECFDSCAGYRAKG